MPGLYAWRLTALGRHLWAGTPAISWGVGGNRQRVDDRLKLLPQVSWAVLELVEPYDNPLPIDIEDPERPATLRASGVVPESPAHRVPDDVLRLLASGRLVRGPFEARY